MKKKIFGTISLAAIIAIAAININVLKNSNNNIKLGSIEALADPETGYTSYGVSRYYHIECTKTTSSTTTGGGNGSSSSGGSGGVSANFAYYALFGVQGNYGSNSSSTNFSWTTIYTISTVTISAEANDCPGPQRSNCVAWNPC